VPGSVNVAQSPVDPLLFTIRFGGALSAKDIPLMTAATTGPVGNAIVTGEIGGTSARKAGLYTGAIAVDPNDPRIIYLGTGEADNSGDSFYGTGVYVSTDAGLTWSLLTNSDGSNPLYGMAVSKIVVDPGPAPTP